MWYGQVILSEECSTPRCLLSQSKNQQQQVQLTSRDFLEVSGPKTNVIFDSPSNGKIKKRMSKKPNNCNNWYACLRFTILLKQEQVWGMNTYLVSWTSLCWTRCRYIANACLAWSFLKVKRQIFMKYILKIISFKRRTLRTKRRTINN